MHPIISEQIARSRVQEMHRQAAIARRSTALRTPKTARLALAAAALRLAQALDREGRVVPAVVTR